LATIGQRTDNALTEERVSDVLNQCLQAINTSDAAFLVGLANQALDVFLQGCRPEVTEVRPQVLECDVVRFQNNREKWVALVGLLNGYPYEIFTGLADDEEGIYLPKNVTSGKIIKQMNPDGTKRYDFQFENRRGYKTTVEGLSEKFNPEYWNYAKLISGVLRYRMPIEHVIKLVASLSLKDESINTWKTGVERALKKYAPGNHDEMEQEGEEVKSEE
jgi:ribonucleoside-diphosphate reductase alpha chain